jgi:hypothetical protein
MLTVITQVALSSISLSTSSVVGGNPVTGTATLTGNAPAGGVTVSLSSGDPVTVPASVTVPAGSFSATFTISTRAVGGTLSGTITGTYSGTSKSAVLAVTRPTTATASFGVTGPSETETCELSNLGSTLNCTFNGSTSTAPGTITEWDWTYGLTTSLAQATTTAVLSNPPFSCNMIPTPLMPGAGNASLTMTVSLKVRDDAGNVSAVVTDVGVRLLPQHNCGY